MTTSAAGVGAGAVAAGVLSEAGNGAGAAATGAEGAGRLLAATICLG